MRRVALIVAGRLEKQLVAKVGWLTGLEPATSGVTIRCSTW